MSAPLISIDNPAAKTKQALRAFHKAGRSAVLCRTADKHPPFSWEEYTKRLATPQDVEQWPACDGVGIIGGKVSGNLECIDFDDAGSRYAAWADGVEAEAPGLVERLTYEQTPSGGYHITYLCPDAVIDPALKLAQAATEVEDGKEKEYNGKKYKPRSVGGKWFINPTFIETRGERSLFLCAPSPGYTLLRGKHSNPAAITPEERGILLRHARLLNEFEDPVGLDNGDGTKYDPKRTDRPGDLYNSDKNREPSLTELLEGDLGCTPAGGKGVYAHFTRPGKDRGISISLINDNVVNCFSSNAYPLEVGKYSPFRLFAALRYDGDHKAAAKALAENGYCPRPDPATAFTEQTDEVGIVIKGGDLHSIVDRAEAEILLRPDLRPEHQVYQRSAQLVRIAQMPDTGTSDGVTRHKGAAIVVEVDRPAILDIVGRYGQFFKYNAKAKGLKRVDPPREIAETYLSRRGMWTVPALRGVVAGPTIMPDGRIIAAPGYDHATGFFFAHDLDVIVPGNPTREDARRAVALLEDLLSGFSFADARDRAVAMAQIVTLVVRPATETAPLIATSAHCRGSGKSHLGDVAAAIGTGRCCTVLSATADPAELEKRIVASMLSGDQLVSLDNVNGNLRSDLLCQAVTSTAVNVRPLGVSQNIAIPNTTTWLANGNNITLAGDLARRAILCRIDPGVERPEERTFAFDPVTLALENRAEYVTAVLTLVRAYLSAGSPALGLKPFGSFGTWCRMGRDPLVWAGCEDPCASRDQILESDPDAEQLESLLNAWWDVIGSGPMTISDAITKAASAEDKGLYEAFVAIAGVRGVIDAKKASYWARSQVGRVANGKRLIKYRGSKRLAQWCVEMAHGL